MTTSLNETSEARPARRLLSGTLRIFAAEALIVPTGVLTAVFLSRRFGPEGYGLLTLAGVTVAWVESNVATALSRPVVKLVGDSEDWRAVASASLRLYVACGVALALLLALSAEPLARALGEGPRLAFYLRLYALEIPIFCAAQAHRSVLVGLGRFRERAWASAARWTARLALVVALVAITESIAAAICASVLASVVELVFCRARVRIGLFGAGGVRRLGGYALPLVASALCLSLFGRLDLLLLKALGGTAADAGLYGVAQNLALLPTLFSFAFAPTLLSTLTRAAREGDAEGAREVAATALRAPLVLAPFAACVAGAADEVVGLLFGARFVGAATPLRLLLFASLALVLVSAAASIWTAAGRTRWTLHAAWPPLVAAAALHAYVIPRAGAAGAAAVTAAVAFVTAVVSAWAACRLWRVRPPWATLARALAVGAGALAASSLVPAPGLWCVLKLAATAALAVVALALLGEFGARPFESARELLSLRRGGDSPARLGATRGASS